MKSASKKEYSKKGKKCPYCLKEKRKWCDCLVGNYRKWLGKKRYGNHYGEVNKMVNELELPFSPRMARFEEAGLLGCFDDTGMTSTNYKDFL